MLNSWTLEFIEVLTDPNFPIHRIPEILNPTNPRLWPVCRVRRSLTNPFEALVSRSWTALPVKGPQGRGVWQVHPHPPNRRRRSASQIHLLWADGSNENWNLTSWRRLERKFSQVVHPMNRHWQAKTQIVIWTETLRKNSVTQNLTQNLITKVETFPCEGGSEESRFSWVWRETSLSTRAGGARAVCRWLSAALPDSKSWLRAWTLLITYGYY